MTDEWRICKYFEGSGRGLIEVLSLYLPGEPEEISKTPSKDSRYSGRNLDLPNTNLEIYRYTNLLCKIACFCMLLCWRFCSMTLDYGWSIFHKVSKLQYVYNYWSILLPNVYNYYVRILSTFWGVTDVHDIWRNTHSSTPAFSSSSLSWEIYYFIF
jgi:hypothetical protein